MHNTAGPEGALHLADLGYRVFPAHAVTQADGRVTKPPMPGVLWRREATTDPVTIRRWWERWPDALVAIACGESGVVAIDVDPRHGGTWSEPSGVGYATLSGGHHWLYAERGVVGCDNTGRVAPGVDVRGLGGYVLCWQPTEVTVGPRDLPPVPERVVDAMRGAQQAVATPDPFAGGTREFTPPQATEYVRREALDPLRSAKEGYRNSTLNAAAVVCGHFAGAFWPARKLAEGLAEVARAIGLDEREIGPTIRSGMRKGMEDPYQLREDPEVAAREPDAVEALRAEILDSEGLDSIGELESLVDGWLFRDTVARVVGAPGHMKSFLVFDMGAFVSIGKPWHGCDVSQGTVLYVAAEGARGFRKRVRAWEKHYGTRLTDFYTLPRPVQSSGPEWETLIKVVAEMRPALIVLDTQARVTVGMEENSNTEMGMFQARADELRIASGACVLIVHHTPKDGSRSGRGGSAILGALETELFVEKKGVSPNYKVTLSNDKQKDEAEHEDMTFDAHIVDLGQDGRGRPSSSVVLLPEVQGPRTVAYDTDFIDGLVMNQSDVMRVVVDLFRSVGGTKAEIKRVTQERRRSAGRKEMASSSFERAWSSLVEKELLQRVEKTQRWTYPGDSIMPTEATTNSDDGEGGE
jgi:hypothetical protein